ncbi:unnamed protein product, partial [Ectocarpus fasciculatus]
MSVTIFGYGSLMDVQSCRRTLPTASNFRKGELPHYRRCYNLVSIGGLKSGRGNMDTLEVAALSIAPCEHGAVLGCLFDIPADELGPYLEREHRYRAVQLEVGDDSSPGVTSLAWTVVEQTDANYAQKVAAEGLDWEERVGRHYRGQLWGRRDVLPMRGYMGMCILAADSLGGMRFVNNMLDYTVLADGTTTLRAYLI